jgi:anti-sigma factor RsiW
MTDRAKDKPAAPTRGDVALMEYADGEIEGAIDGPVDGDGGETSDPELLAHLARDPDAKAKLTAIRQVGELVRGHLELTADAVPDAKFAAMWRRVDARLEAAPVGLWARLSAWFDRYRGHVITGAVSAGAVAALALVLRPSDPGLVGRGGGAIDVRPVALRATPAIDALDTPGGSSAVISLDDEDGHTAVIWVTPEDTVEGI